MKHSLNIRFNQETGILAWSYVASSLRNSIKEYNVRVSVKDLACGTERAFPLNDLATWNCKFNIFSKKTAISKLYVNVGLIEPKSQLRIGLRTKVVSPLLKLAY